MAANLSVTPDSVETYNFGGATMHVANFDTTSVNTGPRTFYSSSLPAVVGYWFNPTDTPTTASLNAVNVSLISGSDGQFRFTASETNRTGKLFILSLT